MAQMNSPDSLQTNPEVPLGEEQSPTGGKKSLLTKLKEKTKGRTKKLKEKIKPGSNEEDSGAADTSSSSSSEDESDAPAKNAVTGVTQPQYQQQLEAGAAPSTDRVTTSPDVPSTNFPGNFGGREVTTPVAKEDDTGPLSRDFAGLSTDDKKSEGPLSTGESQRDEGPLSTGESQRDESDSGKPSTEKASEGLMGMGAAGAAAVGSKASPDSSVDEQGDSVTKKAADGTKKAADTVSREGEDLTKRAADTGKSWSQWAAEKVGYRKDVVASKTSSMTSTEGSPAASSVSEDGNTVTQKAYDSVPEGAKGTTQKAYESVLGVKDAIQDKAIKPAYETVVGSTDTVADEASATADSGTTDPSQKSYVQKAYESVLGTKDAVADKASAQTGGSTTTTTTDPAQQSYVQKATSGIYAAKDTLLSSTQPGEHDKALSQKVTDSVQNLPATIKSTLGFGGKSGASSPTTTPVTESSVTSPSEESAGAPPQSPGLVSRIAAPITSLFGSKREGESTTGSTGASLTDTK